MNYWFTADTHFDHANIIKYSGRPFSDVQEMNEKIIANWNALVKKGDTVYHLGDFSFSHKATRWIEILERLNGQIHLIKGNHDRDKVIKVVQGISGHIFSSVSDYKRIKVQDKDADKGRQEITLMHYAMRVWNKSHYGAWQLYGHSHGTLSAMPESRQLDVGVDTHDFYPWSYDEVKEEMVKVKGHVIDHHKAR